MAKRSKSVELIINDHGSIPSMIGRISSLIYAAIVAGPVVVTLGRISRTIEQNGKMWPMLQDLSRQADYMSLKWPPEDWKIYCYSAWRVMSGNQCRVVMGLEGEMVGLDYSTSALNKSDFASLVESIYSIGARFDVKWSDESLAVYAEYPEFNR